MDFIAHPSRFSSSFSYSFGNIFERAKDFCNFAVSGIIGNGFSAIFIFFFALDCRNLFIRSPSSLPVSESTAHSSASSSSLDVESLMSDAETSCCTNASGALFDLLYEGVKWLNQATKIISASSNSTKCKLIEAEEVLADCQSINIFFPLTVIQIESAIEKHKSWLAQVHQCFSMF